MTYSPFNTENAKTAKPENSKLTSERVVNVNRVWIGEKIRRSHSTRSVVQFTKVFLVVKVQTLTQFVLFTPIIACEYVVCHKWSVTVLYKSASCDGRYTIATVEQTVTRNSFDAVQYYKNEYTCVTTLQRQQWTFQNKQIWFKLVSKWTCVLRKVLDYTHLRYNHCSFRIVNWTVVTYHYIVYFFLRFILGQFSIASWSTSLWDVRVVITLWGREKVYATVKEKQHNTVHSCCFQFWSDVCNVDSIRDFWRRPLSIYLQSCLACTNVIGRFIFILTWVNFSWIGHKFANNMTAILPYLSENVFLNWSQMSFRL